MNKTIDKNHWQTFWEQNMLTPAMSEAIAAYYWDRLIGFVPVAKDWIGLDFGCGQGYLLRKMALEMEYVFGMDASPTMIDNSRLTNSGLKNVTIQRMVTPPSNIHHPLFDLILVNSCIEYLNDVELSDWLSWWLKSLSPRGRLVLSDLFPEKSSRWRNCLKTLAWGWRERCLRSVLYEFYQMVKYRYFREVHYGRTPDRVLQLVRESGGDGQLLPHNIDFLSTRYSIVVKQKQ
ncbi:MAG: class I SAM-dependent methyltransferase [Candidatus Euphemobacter frigidus]|nr:class I SAM-dependent methyltransferase [Candidatus Euphemobacter frigidus]